MKISCERAGGMFFRQIVDLFTVGHHSHTQNMARILSDKEIKTLLKDVIIGADPNLVSPNGIELRLGKEVRFLSTGEKKTIPEGHFLTVHPGEAVLITSLEKLDFQKSTIHKHFPNCSLMAIITPTTTMMREGMLQCATKIHAGYEGDLNWSFRNSSSKDFIIQQGESLFNLTLFLLQGDEVPEVHYGEKKEHSYQKTSGIKTSQRKTLADPAKEQLVSSSLYKLDPKTQLHEFGHPFNYIGTELTRLDDRLVIVSSDMVALGKKIDDMNARLTQIIEATFQSKFFGAGSISVGAIVGLYALGGLIRQKANMTSGEFYWLAAAAAVGICLFGWLVFYRKKP